MLGRHCGVCRRECGVPVRAHNLTDCELESVYVPFHSDRHCEYERHHRLTKPMMADAI